MSDHVAEIESGKLRGVVLRGAHAFLGVPYGAPTGGRHRFLPPRPPAPWRAIRDATGCRVKAPQLLPDLPLFPLLDPPDLAPSSEDCLTLNVWTPATDAGRRPVMVWFHGGAFQYGSSNHPRLQGMRLCRRDVVLVTVNQRLDVFGHLDLSEVGGEAFAHSANAGTLDMVAALE